MTPLEQILLGLVMGFCGVGLPTIRTIQAMEGKYIRVFFVSLLATVNLYAFTRFAVKDNYWWMAANMLGAATAVSVIAYRRQNEKRHVSPPAQIADH